jgi:hypothetical protein
VGVERTVILMVLGIVVPLALQLWDRRRLDEEQRARAWNFASWGAALYAFGPLSLLGWYWVTRRGWRRLYGPVAVLAVATVITAIDAVLLEMLSP